MILKLKNFRKMDRFINLLISRMTRILIMNNLILKYVNIKYLMSFIREINEIEKRAVYCNFNSNYLIQLRY